MPRDVLCFLLGQSKTPFAKARLWRPTKNYTRRNPCDYSSSNRIGQTAVSVHDRFSLASWQNCENQSMRSDTAKRLRLDKIREALLEYGTVILVRNFCLRSPEISDPAGQRIGRVFTITVRVVLAPHLGCPWLISLPTFCFEGQDKLGALSRIVRRQNRDLRAYQEHKDRCPIGQTSANLMRPY